VRVLPDDLTIVIPTRNESANIARCLRAIPPEFLVVLVDASVDGTCEVARGTRPHHLRIVRDRGNVATARQLGSELARREWLLFSDADVELAPDYFEQLRGLRPDERQGAILGAKLSLGRYRGYYRCFSAWLGLVSRIGLPAASGSNMLVRRAALRQVGGFDTSLSCNEDSELVWRIQRHGFEVTYCGALRAHEFDHRRLDAGTVRKTVHSLVRCALIDCGLLSEEQKRADWGYWSVRDSTAAAAEEAATPRRMP
jgi:GT2 family glycosyltransferase